MTRSGEGVWFRLAVAVLRPPLVLLTRRRWRGQDHVPRAGGVIVCSNHISHVDPLTLAHFLYDSGRHPRFLAKASLFKAPVIGRVLRSSGQIPVLRDSADAAKALAAAVAAVNAGECVALYPEGTLTFDPGLWPMVAKTGAARLALTTGAPVIPVAQWGPQDVLPPGGHFPKLLPRHTIQVLAGPPVDLTGFGGGDIDAALLAAASERIMAAITELLGQLRDQVPPAVRPRRVDKRRPSLRRSWPSSLRRRSA